MSGRVQEATELLQSGLAYDPAQHGLIRDQLLFQEFLEKSVTAFEEALQLVRQADFAPCEVFAVDLSANAPARFAKQPFEVS